MRPPQRIGSHGNRFEVKVEPVLCEFEPSLFDQNTDIENSRPEIRDLCSQINAPQRPDCVAENAVEYEPVSVPANREIYRGLAVSGLYSGAFAPNLEGNSGG